MSETIQALVWGKDLEPGDVLILQSRRYLLSPWAESDEAPILASDYKTERWIIGDISTDNSSEEAGDLLLEDDSTFFSVLFNPETCEEYHFQYDKRTPFRVERQVTVE